MKNKVEAHHRKFKSSANKNNHVSYCNANVKIVALSKKSESICLSCNECLFFANHDAFVVQYLKKMQKRLKWITTGKTYKMVGKPCPPSSSNDMSTIVVPLGHILTTTVIPVDAPSPKLSRRYVNPFNLHDFGFEIFFRDEELPPWKFGYLGVT
ncbi:hypothetical protein Tco_0889335 [Tanacetum coccineum]